MDELKAFRDEDYNISISCIRHINHLKSAKANKCNSDKKVVTGESIPGYVQEPQRIMDYGK